MPTEAVAVFWDLDKLSPPFTSSQAVVDAIVSTAQENGAVTLFKAYTNNRSTLSESLRYEIQMAGVLVTCCPPDGFKSNMISVDMLSYAMDHVPPATIVLISDDHELAYALSLLRLMKFHNIVVAPYSAHAHLKIRASRFVAWDTIVGQCDSDPGNESYFQRDDLLGAPTVVHTKTLEPTKETQLTRTLSPSELLAHEEIQPSFDVSEGHAVSSLTPHSPSTTTSLDASGEASDPLAASHMSSTAPSTEPHDPTLSPPLQNNIALGSETIQSKTRWREAEDVVATHISEAEWSMGPSPTRGRSLSPQPRRSSHTLVESRAEDTSHLSLADGHESDSQVDRDTTPISHLEMDGAPKASDILVANNAQDLEAPPTRGGSLAAESVDSEVIAQSSPSAPDFVPLIEALQRQIPKRTAHWQIANDIREHHPLSSYRHGVGWKQYIALAEAAGIIKIGEFEVKKTGKKTTWLSLNSDWRTRLDYHTSTTAVPPVVVQVSPTTVHEDHSCSPAHHAHVPACPTNLETIPIPSEPLPPMFQLLIKVLREEPGHYLDRPAAAARITQRDPLVYSNAGRKSPGKYFRLAAEHGIIVLNEIGDGHGNRMQWVSLAPAWRLPSDGLGDASGDPFTPPPEVVALMPFGQVPAQFLRLFRLLEAQPRVRMSDVAAAAYLVNHHTTTDVAGVTSQDEYFRSACQYGLVTLSECVTTSGWTRWVILNPGWYWTVDNSGSIFAAIPIPANIRPPSFQQLVEILREQPGYCLERQLAADRLIHNDPLTFTKAGVINYQRYFKLARKEGIVTLGLALTTVAEGKQKRKHHVTLTPAWRLPLLDAPVATSSNLHVLGHVGETTSLRAPAPLATEDHVPTLSSFPQVQIASGSEVVRSSTLLASLVYPPLQPESAWRETEDLIITHDSEAKCWRNPSRERSLSPEPPLSRRAKSKKRVADEPPLFDDDGWDPQLDWEAVSNSLAEPSNPLVVNDWEEWPEASNTSATRPRVVPVFNHSLGMSTSAAPATPLTPHSTLPSPLEDTTASPFHILVEQLRRQSESHPECEKIDQELRARDPLIYLRAGVTTFALYASLAKQAGIVTTGQLKTSQAGTIDWISLNANWRPSQENAPTLETPHPLFGPLIMLLRESGGNRVDRDTAAAILQTRDPLVYTKAVSKNSSVKYFRKAAALDIITLTENAAGSRWISLNSTWKLPGDDPASPASPSTKKLLLLFSALIELLRDQPGHCMPRTSVATFLENADPLIYTRAGVKNANTYLKRAKKAGIIKFNIEDDTVTGKYLCVILLAPAWSLPSVTESIATGFDLLITRLQEMRTNGVPRPYRLTVHIDLIGLKPSIYAEAGVQDSSEYFNLAKDAGVVELGGVGAREYISLI